MDNNYTVLRRGFFKGEKTCDFVSLNKYLFLCEGRNRYLLLHLNNDRNERLESIGLEVLQKDAKGRVIGTLRVEFFGLGVKPSSEFFIDNKIALVKIASDFEVRVVSAGYGAYVYTQDNSGVHLSHHDPHSHESIPPKFKFTPADNYNRLYGYNPRNDYASLDVFSPPTLADLEISSDDEVIDNAGEKVSDLRRKRLVATLKDMFFWGSEGSKKGNERVTLRRYKVSFVACIVALILLSVFAVAAYFELNNYMASANSFHYKGVEYAFATADDSISAPIIVIGSKSSQKSIVIPEKVLDHEVVGMADNAFLNNTNITKLTILARIGTISSYAFSGCVNLESVTLSHVEKIDEYAFRNCESLKKIDAPWIDSIARYAFSGCTSLEEFSATSLSSLGSYAFNNCTSLKSVYLGYSFETITIGYRAFNICSKLTSVVIAQHIDYSSNVNFFNNCTSLTSLSLRNLNYGYDVNGEQIELKSVTLDRLFGENYFYQTNLRSLSVDYMSAIPNYFAVNLSLRALSVKNLESPIIPDLAFYNSEYFTTLDLPLAVTSVGDEAFFGTAISEFDASSLTHIGKSAFARTTNLTSIDLSSCEEITIIPESCFEGATSLTNIELPPSLVSIDANAFKECISLQSISFGESLTKIGDSAFFGAGSLKTVTFNSSPALIEQYAFADCFKLQTVNFSDKITSIRELAFAGCRSLVSVVLPSSVNAIGGAAFAGCEALVDITVPFVGGRLTDENSFSFIFNGVPSSLRRIRVLSAIHISAFAFYEVSSAEEIVFETDYTYIGEYAFYACFKLNNFVIPSKVQSIGENAFALCYKLYDLYNLSPLKIERGSTNHGEAGLYAFGIYHSLLDTRTPTVLYENNYKFYLDEREGAGENKWYLVDSLKPSSTMLLPSSFYYNYSLVTSYKIAPHFLYGNGTVNKLTIPMGVTAIGREAFLGCTELTTITIERSVLEIGFRAFGSCSSLTTLTIPFIGATPEYLGGFTGTYSDSGHLGYIFGASYYYDNSVSVPSSLRSLTVTDISFVPDYAFYQCYFLESIKLPGGVTTIGMEAFYNAGITSFVAPESLATVKESAFYECFSLVNISFGSSLTSLGRNAFYRATNLKSVEFSDYTIETLSTGTFSNCSSLENVTLPSGLKTISSDAFYSCASLTSITLPSTVSAIGPNAFSGCFLLNDVTNLSTINLSPGSVTYGYVAYYALRVSKTIPASPLLSISRSNSRFVLYDDVWYLVYIESYGSYVLPTSFSYNATTVTSYVLMETAFTNRLFSSINIPLAVQRIEARSLHAYSISSLHYGGTELQWNDLTKNILSSPLKGASVYYFHGT